MKKKRILIDASTINSKTDGLTIYIINLIKYLPLESFKDFEYWILLNPGICRHEIDELRESGNFIFIEYSIHSIGPRRDWAMAQFLRKHSSKFDLIHITSNTYPFYLKGGICTIHDITFKKYFDGSMIFSRMAQFYINQVVINCLKKSKYIIAVSKSTKSEICKAYNPKGCEDKIKVIYEGWQHILSNFEDSNNMITEFKQPYLFYLGTFRKHKNIANLLSAFEIACDKIPGNVKLIISGSNKYINLTSLETINKINKNGERVFFTGYLSDASLANYYKNALGFIFPSLSEGFGIPILEAFYYNCPLLCSNTTSFTEIAGNAALYFDPFNPIDMANTIINFCESIDKAESMRIAGQERLQLFSWTKTSKQTVDLYYKYFST